MIMELCDSDLKKLCRSDGVLPMWFLLLRRVKFKSAVQPLESLDLGKRLSIEKVTDGAKRLGSGKMLP